MEPLIIPLVGGAIAIAVAIMLRGGVEKPWREVASQLGLQYVPHTLLESQKLTGTLDGYDLTIDIITRGSGNSRRSFTRFLLRAPRIPIDIALAGETFWSGLDLMGQEIEIGDKHFDDAVKVRGLESTMLALLDHSTRELVTEYVATDRGQVKDRILEGTTGGRMKDVAKMVQRARRMVVLARRLEISDDHVPDRIAKNVAEDANAAVRLRNLHYLGTYKRRSPACERAAAHAVESPHPELRFAGANLMGPKGAVTLEGLVTDDGVESELRARALASVKDKLPRADLVSLIERTLETRTVQLLAAALDIIAVQRLTELTNQAERYLTHVDPSVAARAATAVGRVNATGAAGRLVKLLDHADISVCTAAATALGEVGGIDAVEPLLDHTKGVFKNSELKSAARGAIDAIQNRAGGADGGRLSVLQAEDQGALSVSQDAGGMAIVDDD